MIITVLLVSAWVPMTNPMTSNTLTPDPTSEVVLSYVSHGVIDINGDTDFNDTATSESWEGDGSSGDPFIIDGYEIHSFVVALIIISNTRYHFEIQNCNLTFSGTAIRLQNVTNGLIENCLIVDVDNGVILTNVTGIDVVGCDVSMLVGTGDSGIFMDDAIDCSISSCVIQGVPTSDSGIYGQHCEGITLFNNTVFEWDDHGIFFGGCYDMDILNNTVYWNEGSGGGGCGIQIVESELAYILGNNITENMDNGITIADTDNVTIIENHIDYNWIHGISVASSEYCIIQDNWIGRHGDGIIEEGPACGITTYFADYTQIIGNDFFDNALNSITLGYSDFCYISNNFLNYSYDHGMWVYISHNATIEENEIYNSYGIGSGPSCGILVEWSNDTILNQNTLGHNSENGISLEQSHDGVVNGNTIFDSEFSGIFAYDSSGWDISHNVIYDNGAPGIVMEKGAHDNYVYYNDIGWSGEFLVLDNGVGNYWNYSGVGNWYSDYSGTGTYTIPGSASEIDYYPSMSLYSGVTSPGEYEAGTTGNTMTWNSSALNPGTYELLIDNEPQGPVVWDGDTIVAEVDGLPAGVYNVTLVTYHVSGHWLANQSTLTVVDTMAPSWTVTPEDQTVDYNVALSYQLQASDPSGIESWAVNNTVSFAISSSGLLTNATALDPGIYYVEVTVTDEYSHSVTVTIMITVNEPVPPPDSTLVTLAIAGVGAGVVIVILVIVFKKKGS